MSGPILISSNPPPSTATGAASASTTGNVITSEMFSSAIQQAFGAAFGASTPSTPNPSSNTNRSGEEETIEGITRRLQPQLRQMREMGLTNDSVNVRALQATSGDVQAAIELVFSGAID